MVQRTTKTSWDQRVQKRLSAWALCCIVVFFVLKRDDVHSGLGEWLWIYMNKGVIISGIGSFILSGMIGFNTIANKFDWKGAGIKFIQALSDKSDDKEENK